MSAGEAADEPLGRRAARKARALAGRLARRAGLRNTAPAPAYLPAPTVVRETTNYGPEKDELDVQKRNRQRMLHVNADYDLVRENFDYYNFLLGTDGLADDPGADPIRHYLNRLSSSTASPDHNFSAKQYLRRHPEHTDGPERTPYLEWLKRGRAAGEIADPSPGIEKMAPVLGLEPHELVQTLVESRDDVQHRLRHGVLGQMISRAAEIEPLVGAAWKATPTVNQLPLGTQSVVVQVSAIHACQEAAGFRTARLLFVVNRPRWGGGRRIEGHIAHALADHISPEEIVVIYTDDSGTSPSGRFPAGVREIDFASTVRGAHPDNAMHALTVLIRSFRADAVVNINSRLLYRALTPYGKALAASERIFLTFFCNEQNALGMWEGWSLKWYYRGADIASGIITDSDHMRDALIEAHQLPESAQAKLHVLGAPVEPGLRRHDSAPSAHDDDSSRRPQVFWAGRWDRQKRVDIAYAIARLMPDVDFRLWGEAVLQGVETGPVPDNVSLEGRYGHISELDCDQADAWLYTSAWDGVPSLLLEVAMLEVPIVGSLVGGTGEVLGADDSWPIEDWEDPSAYVAALREVLADPPAARRRAQALRERLSRERTQQSYARVVADLLLLDDNSPTDSAEVSE